MIQYDKHFTLQQSHLIKPKNMAYFIKEAHYIYEEPKPMSSYLVKMLLLNAFLLSFHSPPTPF